MAEVDAKDPADFSQMGECPACKVGNVKLKNIAGLLICEKCAAKRFSSKVRKSIQDAVDRQHEQRQRESWRKRVAIAKRGMQLYEQNKYIEALRVFNEYISIVERHNGVSPGALHPDLFDEKKGAIEILLITGIYWDLAKIYDHVKGKEIEMRLCLEKYVAFSIRRRHLLLASEAMRRHIRSGRCVHKDDFRNAHNELRAQLSRCFIAGALFGPASPQVAALCAFRDRTLLASRAGRLFVEVYYRLSPPVACLLLRMPPLAWFFRALLRPVAWVVGLRQG